MSKTVTPAVKLLAAIALSCVLLAGCAGTASSPRAAENDAGNAAETSVQVRGANTPLRKAEVGLRPVAGSGVSAKADFQEIPEGAQFTLEVSGLPNHKRQYFSQVHGGSCADVRRRDEQRRGGPGSSLALVRLDRFFTRAPEYADHPKYPPPPDDELPGDIDVPMTIVASFDGSAFVSTLLEGVTIEELASGGPKYLDLSIPNSKNPEDWPSLACADLGEGGKPDG